MSQHIANNCRRGREIQHGDQPIFIALDVEDGDDQRTCPANSRVEEALFRFGYSAEKAGFVGIWPNLIFYSLPLRNLRSVDIAFLRIYGRNYKCPKVISAMNRPKEKPNKMVQDGIDAKSGAKWCIELLWERNRGVGLPTASMLAR